MKAVCIYQMSVRITRNTDESDEAVAIGYSLTVSLIVNGYFAESLTRSTPLRLSAKFIATARFTGPIQIGAEALTVSEFNCFDEGDDYVSLDTYVLVDEEGCIVRVFSPEEEVKLDEEPWEQFLDATDEEEV